jgi:hypothetical protein
MPTRLANLLMAVFALPTFTLNVFDGGASLAAKGLPPAPANIGLPPAPTIIRLPPASKMIGLPGSSPWRPGILRRRSDGSLGYFPAPMQVEKIVALPVVPIKRFSRFTPGARTEFNALVRELAPLYGLDPDLVAAVVITESGFRADAVSPKGATGLMQLMPGTARRFGVRDRYHPMQNLRGGMSYLRWLLSYFRGDVRLVLAAYNAGERAVERHGGIPPYAETQNYVKQVMRAYQQSTHPFDRRLTRASPIVTRSGGQGKSEHR